MLLIALAATAGFGLLGMGVLVLLLLRQRMKAAAELQEVTRHFAASEDMLADIIHNRDREIARMMTEHWTALCEADNAARAEASTHQQKLAALRREHAELVAHLEADTRSAREAADAMALRWQTLMGGHEFHKGGKVASHGGVSVLYNCVTCPPEANVRLLAPRGFFAPEEADDGET